MAQVGHASSAITGAIRKVEQSAAEVESRLRMLHEGRQPGARRMEAMSRGDSRTRQTRTSSHSCRAVRGPKWKKEDDHKSDTRPRRPS